MINEIAELRRLVEESVRENTCEGILLSGGLDTSILASVAARHNPDLKAFTVAFGEAPDLYYSTKLARLLHLEHHILNITGEDLTANIKPTVEILRSFDPMEVRNSAAIYSGLKFARDYAGSIMTGDGGDELFFGYSFLQKMNKKELLEYASCLYRVMHFSSVDLGRGLGITVRTPYLTPGIKSFALTLKPELKIRDGVGKWILRKAFESEMPSEFAWRKKTPIEYGSGSTSLKVILEAKMADEEFARKKLEYRKKGVEIRGKEQLYYYEIYRKVVGAIPSPKEGEARCRGCGGGLPHDKTYCRICGEENAKTQGNDRKNRNAG